MHGGISMEKELNDIKKDLIKKVYMIGPVRLAVYIPTNDYHAINYLCDEVPNDSNVTNYDYELVMYDLHSMNNIKYDDYIHFGDKTFRANRFKSGFYLTHHFGESVLKITRGKTHFIIGRNISKLLWSFYIKFYLCHYSTCNDLLHLKAAAVADKFNNVTIIIGKGSGGKSVLLNKLMTSGYRFLSNTHILISNGSVLGVNTAIRFRNDPYFSKYIANGMAKEHIEQGEYIISPNSIYDDIVSEGYLKNIVIANYGSGETGIFEVDQDYSTNIIRNFSYPLNTYAMKDDYLEMVNGSLSDFIELYSKDISKIMDVTESSKNIYCNFEIENSKDYDKLLQMLR
jgi:hypothetical protein